MAQVKNFGGGTIRFNEGIIVSGSQGASYETLIVSGGAVFNEEGLIHDFRVESDGNTHMLFVDGVNDRVGIGTTAPTSVLHVSGSDSTDLFHIKSDSDADILVVLGSAVGVGIDIPDSDTKLHVEGLALLNGGVRHKITSISANYTATTSDHLIDCNTNSNAITISLPAANVTNVGLTYVVKDTTGNAVTNNITLDANASETIDNAATYVITNNRECVTIINDGTNGWLVLNNYVPI